MPVHATRRDGHIPRITPLGINRISFSRIVSVFFISGLFLLFLLAAIDKLAHYDRFVTALNSYVLVPPGWAPYVAPAVIVAELWVAIGLCRSAWRRIAALAMFFLLLAFAVALAVNVSLGITGGCGCWFTITLGKASFAHVFQNVLLALLALSIWYEESRRAAGTSHEERLAEGRRA